MGVPIWPAIGLRQRFGDSDEADRHSDLIAITVPGWIRSVVGAKRRDLAFDDLVFPKKPKKLPVVLSPALREGDRATAADIEANAALLEAQLGNSARARQLAAAAEKLGGQAAMALALIGDADSSTKLADGLASHAPPGSFANKVWVPEIRAVVELKRDNPLRAVELLAPVATYEAGWFDNFMAAYVRGQVA
jgi:hypothetical protein